MAFLKILLLLRMLFASFWIFGVDAVRGLRVVRYGKTIADKLNICCWYLLLSRNPHLPWNNLSSISSTIDHILTLLSEKTRCVMNGITFALGEMSDIWVLDKSFEPWMDKFLKVKEGEVFLDVGAHIGKYTFQKAKEVGKNGLVIAIEPHPRNFMVLLKSIRENDFDNIVAFNVAAWNKNCEMELYSGRYSTLHSLKKSFQEQQGYSSRAMPLKVKARRLDDVLKTVGVNVDWIKIDVEGAEKEALLGLEKTLGKSNPKIVIETWEFNPKQLVELMGESGYVLGDIKTIGAGVDWIKAGVVPATSTYSYFYHNTTHED